MNAKVRNPSLQEAGKTLSEFELWISFDIQTLTFDILQGLL
jgi:hypothetical protein